MSTLGPFNISAWSGGGGGDVFLGGWFCGGAGLLSLRVGGFVDIGLVVLHMLARVHGGRSIPSNIYSLCNIVLCMCLSQ